MSSQERYGEKSPAITNHAVRKDLEGEDNVAYTQSNAKITMLSF